MTVALILTAISSIACHVIISGVKFFDLEYEIVSKVKNYFTGHQTDNTIHPFRDSVPVLKIHGRY